MEDMEYEAIANDLRTRLDEQPDDVILMTHLAHALMEIREFTSSLEWFKLAARVKPCVQTLNNLAYFYLVEGEPVGAVEWRHREKKAARVLKKAVALNPATYFPYAILGTVFMKMGQIKRALPAFEKAMAIEANPINLNNLGAALYMAGRIEDASPHFSRAYSMGLSQDDAIEAQLSYGFSLALTGHEEEAVQAACDLAGKAHFWLPDVAGLFYTAGNDEQAAKVFAACFAGSFSKTPDWIEPYMHVLARLGRLSDAEAIKNGVLEELREWIADLKEQSKEKDPHTKNDFPTLKRRGLPATIRAEKQNMRQINKAFARIASGYRPIYAFHPALLQECWFFGCLRHGNPDCAG